MQLFMSIVVLFVSVTELYSYQSTVNPDPKNEVCFDIYVNIILKANTFEAYGNALSLFSEDFVTRYARLERNNLTQPNHLEGCSETEANINATKPRIMIQAVCAQEHHIPGTMVMTSTNFTIIDVKAVFAQTPVPLLGVPKQFIEFTVTCTTKDGGNTLGGIEIVSTEEGTF